MESFSALLACSVVVLMTIHVLYMLHKQKRTRASGGACLPPGPSGHPFLGNLLYALQTLRHNPHRELASLARTYGPVASLQLGLSRAVVVVSSPAAAHEALIKNDAALAARLVPDTMHALSYSTTSMVFLPSTNQLWRQHRAMVGARFATGRGLDAILPVLERHACRLAEYLGTQSGRPVAVREVVNRTVLNVVSNLLFSEDVVDMSVEEGAHRFQGIIPLVLADWSRSSVSDAFPFLAPIDHLLGSHRRISMNLAKLFKFFDDDIIGPRLLANTSEEHDDVLDFLLARHAESKITRQEITTFLTDMFVVATDTSTVTVQRALAQLLRLPEKMEKVNAELAACLGSSDFVRESDLYNLPYLQAVVKETLRLYPAAPLISREVVSDGVSLGGFPVPNGTGVIVNLWAIGRDPKAWPYQPEEFVPERFLAGHPAHYPQGIDAFAYRPFGAGRRVCPGMDYTMRSVPLLLASLLHKTKWNLPDGMAPEDMDLRDRYGTVLDLATPFHAVPVKSMTAHNI
ncbi:hypothetical protein EJB05_55080, partial [Eragrostis curvula]